VLNDIEFDGDSSGGCQCSDWNFRVSHAKDRELSVVFAEVLAPVAHAVHLIYHESSDSLLGIELVKDPHEAL